MRVTVDEIKSKIKDLPANVRDFVTIDPENASLADVKSFTSDGTYAVHIKPHIDDTGDNSILSATCGCAAHKLCKHVVAFWAIAKGELPTAGFMPKKDQEPAEPESGDLRTSFVRNLDDLTRLTKEAIHADLLAHEARAAMLEEIKRLSEER